MENKLGNLTADQRAKLVEAVRTMESTALLLRIEDDPNNEAHILALVDSILDLNRILKETK